MISSGARDGHEEAGAGGGAAEEGGPGEEAAGGDEQAAEADRAGGEAAGEAESAGRKGKKQLRSRVIRVPEEPCTRCHLPADRALFV